MFAEASSFNQPLVWNVNNVHDMSSMFKNATSFNQPLDWNVSSVRDMSYMFKNARSFNQALNWDVSNVENMQNMFENATSFNQPLRWNVINVQNMSSMFAEATSFNQPLNEWNISNVRNMNNMFRGATSFNQSLDRWIVNATMDNMFYGAIAFRFPPPRQIQQQPQPQQPQIQGRAYEIHNAFHKLHLDHFIFIIKSHLKTHINAEEPLFEPLIRYIQSSNFSPQEKEQHITNLSTIKNAIMPSLQRNTTLLEKIITTIYYVAEQPPEFVDLYLNNFTFDCLNAYEINQISCVKGMIERVFLIVRDVVATFCAEEGNPMCKEEYRELLKTFYPEIDLNKMFQDWYTQYSEEEEIIAMTAEQRKEHFKNYVSEVLNNEEEYQEVSEKLEKYIQDNNEIFNTLVLGGGKKTNRRTRRTRRTRKTRTRKTRKTRKTRTRTRTRTRKIRG